LKTQKKLFQDLRQVFHFHQSKTFRLGSLHQSAINTSKKSISFRMTYNLHQVPQERVKHGLTQNLFLRKRYWIGMTV